MRWFFFFILIKLACVFGGSTGYSDASFSAMQITSRKDIKGVGVTIP